MHNFLYKLREYLLKYEFKIVLFVAFCLISAISFEFGVLQGQKWQQKPLIIEKPSSTSDQAQIGQNEASEAPENVSASSLPTKSSLPLATSNAPLQIAAGCAYVGSKTSNKFYLPTCSYAKRVKPENLVCFKSADEATGQGRTQSSCGK